MSHPLENNIRKYPFTNMKIENNKILNKIKNRSHCVQCGKSRKYYCYTCFIPVEQLKYLLPQVKIPIKIDIIKHKNEIDGKSTAGHAAVLADNVRIFTYPDIPDYTMEENIILIFPGTKSLPVSHFFNKNIQLETKENFGFPKGYNMGTLLRVRMDETKVETENISNSYNCTNKLLEYNVNNLPIKRAVFIDSTWNQCRGIYKDPRICSLKSVVLQNRLSQFWRHQKRSPRWYLATVEAIHQFLLEVHVNAWGLNKHYSGLENLELCEKFYENVKIISDADKDNMDSTGSYNGQYDNLLYFFSHMYDLIHLYYDHNQLKSYKRPI